MKKYTPIRSPDTTQISITLPTELLKELDEAAFAQDRNRSNLITVILKATLHHAKMQNASTPCPASGCGQRSEKAS